ncbi:MAG: CvpA family protein [Verrucomicrobiota bacterium]|nr:CvpA family protein [Verrucomicrobiota bacterium]
MIRDATAGSPLWQIAFVSFAVVLILFEVLRGYQQGLARQVVRLFAVIAAYASAYFGGPLLLPLLRPILVVPDFLISPIGGAVLALIVYALITFTGRMLFKPTREQQPAAVRLIYGLSGGFIGVIFGLFFMWLLLVGLRSLGSVADAQLHARVTDQPPIATRVDSPIGNRRGHAESRSDASSALATLLARLKNSVELGSVGEVVKKTDLLPAGSYQTLGEVGAVLAKPRSAERLLEFPGVRELGENPKIMALCADPEIARMIDEGRYLDLLRDPRLVDALNDPALIERLRKFDVRRALDYAGKEN